MNLKDWLSLPSVEEPLHGSTQASERSSVWACTQNASFPELEARIALNLRQIYLYTVTMPILESESRRSIFSARSGGLYILVIPTLEILREEQLGLLRKF